MRPKAPPLTATSIDLPVGRSRSRCSRLQEVLENNYYA